jgi:hypothetical protein
MKLPLPMGDKRMLNKALSQAVRLEAAKVQPDHQKGCA